MKGELRQARAFGYDELSKILSHYPFYEGRIDSWIRIPQKLYNNNYCVNIDSIRWVVKCYSSSAVTERLKISHNVQLFLQKQNFPVACLETTNKGFSLVEESGQWFSVHRWVEGRQLSPFSGGTKITDATFGEVARVLAKMHLFLAAGNFGPQNEKTVMHGSLLFRRLALDGSALNRSQGCQLSSLWLLRLKQRKNQFDKWILARLPSLIIFASRLEKQFVNTSGFGDEVMPIHNDINWENLIFSESNNLLAVIDFDNLIFGPRICEVGAAAIVIAGPDQKRIDSFIRDYSLGFGQSCSELSIWVAMVLKCLRSIFFSIRSYLDGKAKDLQILQTWCLYLDQCLEVLSKSSPPFLSSR